MENIFTGTFLALLHCTHKKCSSHLHIVCFRDWETHLDCRSTIVTIKWEKYRWYNQNQGHCCKRHTDETHKGLWMGQYEILRRKWHVDLYDGATPGSLTVKHRQIWVAFSHYQHNSGRQLSCFEIMMYGKLH